MALLWAAIYSSPVRPRFPRWVQERLGFELFVLPGLATLKLILEKAGAHAQEVGRQCWKAKRESFAAELEDSWKKKSGSLAYRLIKDRPHLPVLEMEVHTAVKLKPERWLPDGKQWIQVFPGHEKLLGDADCEVVEVLELSIKLNQRVSRKEAASLEKVEVSLDPAVWSKSFFDGWSELAAGASV